MACFSLAQARESNIFIEQVQGANQVSQKSGPDTEFQLAYQSTFITPINRPVKKITDGSEFPLMLITDCIFVVHTSVKGRNSLHSKSYLFYIYPSHHFW